MFRNQNKNNNKQTLLSQPGLIKQIIEAVSMKDGNSVNTPAVPKALGSGIDGKVF
jgi:hypothetical protein